MVSILIVPVTLANLRLFKIKVFLNKDCDIKTYIHDVTNKISLRDSCYLVDVFL